MLRPKCIGLFIVIITAALSGCASEGTLPYCSAEVGCPAGQVCDPATNSCEPVGDAGGVADGLPPDSALPDGARPDAGLPDSGLPDSSPPDSSPPDSALPGGGACAKASACKSGHCVDGVCCDSACSGACRSCKLPGKAGTCALTAKGLDPDGECKGTHAKCGGACDGQGACAFAPAATTCGSDACAAAKVTTYGCNGKGGCVNSITTCGGFGCASSGAACRTSCSASAHCQSGFQCLGGACVSNLANGKACGTNNKACGSGNCVNGVCCASTACGTCNRCDVKGKAGACAPVADNTTCGSSKCVGGFRTDLVCKTGACTSASKSCGSYACNGSGDACLKACSSSLGCAPGNYCLGGLCLPKAKKGAKCTGGAMCISGSCVDGVCCGAASCGLCKRCNVKGKEGACAPVANNTVCGKPTCTASSFTQDVATRMVCVAGSCTAKAKPCGHYLCDAAKTACSQKCAAGKGCYNSAYCYESSCLEKKPKGAKCSDKGQCKSGFCVDGYCCDGLCNQECGACNLAGKIGTCSPRSSGTKCYKDNCSSGIHSAFRCDGKNTNCPHKLLYCAPYKCNASKNGCSASCTKHDQCSTGYCDTSDFFKAKNTCALKSSSVCHVHPGACGDGAKGSPACSIQKCLDRKARYVLVADGKYSENLVVKADVAIIATGTTGTLVVNGLPQANVAKVFLTPPATNTPGVLITGGQRALLHGLDISHSGAGASGDLIRINGATSVIIRSCAVHDGKGTSSSGVSMVAAGEVTLRDSAVYKLQGYGLVSLASKQVRLESVGLALAAYDNLQVIKGKLHLRDVLSAWAGKAGINAVSLNLEADRVRTILNGTNGFGADGCGGRVSNLLSTGNVQSGVSITGGGSPSLSNLTVADNAPKSLSSYDIYCDPASKAKIHNSIVWSTAASGVKHSINCAFSHSNVRTGGSKPVAGTKNMAVTPQFVGGSAHPYSLSGSSPCVDAGDDAVLVSFGGRDKDLAGKPRFRDKSPGGSKLDLGAYEVQ